MQIIGFDIIKQFSLDYLHLCCLGIMRKLMNYWCKKDCLGNRKVLLSLKYRELFSKRMIYFAKFTPSEFARKPRHIKELDRFKATEFRLLLLYTGPVVLKRLLSDDLYNHFLLFHSSIRILSSKKLFSQKNLLENARQMLLRFVTKISALYGKEACIYNVHSLIHLADDVENTKLSLNDLSCFPFESFLGYMIRQIRGANRPLEQLVKRLSEKSICDVMFEEKEDFTLNATNRLNIKTLSFKNFLLRSVGMRDCYVLLKNNCVLKITDIDNSYLTGFVSSKLQNFYSYPLHSEKVGVFKFVSFSHDKINCCFEDIASKVFVMTCKNIYVAVQLLHASEC